MEEIKRDKEQRTLAQNSALHLLFRRIATVLNEAGYDVRKTTKVMKEGVELPWSDVVVKELLWRFCQKAILSKHSTKTLKKQEEIDLIYMTLTRFLGERLGIEMPPFPSINELENNENQNKKNMIYLIIKSLGHMLLLIFLGLN